jgi:hypothetical protein
MAITAIIDLRTVAEPVALAQFDKPENGGKVFGS